MRYFLSDTHYHEMRYGIAAHVYEIQHSFLLSMSSFISKHSCAIIDPGDCDLTNCSQRHQSLDKQSRIHFLVTHGILQNGNIIR